METPVKDQKKINGEVPVHQENLPATYRAVAKAMSAPNITQRLTNVLPSTIPVERFRSVAMHYLMQNPDLANCTPNSLMLALTDAAESGLLPDRVYGQAYIVRFKNEAVFVVGYRGYIQLVMNSGKIDSVHAGLVYQTDQFEVIEGTEMKITHLRDLKVDRAKTVPIACYAVAFVKGARNPEFVIMSQGEVEQIRQRSFSGNSPAWKNSYGEMMRKTAIRRLCKTLPMSTVDKAGKVAAAEEESERIGKPVHIEGDYTHIEGIEDAGSGSTADSGQAAASAEGSDSGVHSGDTRPAGDAGPERDIPAVSEQPIKKHSTRLKRAFQQSVEQEALAAAKEQPPHDSETGEILEGDLLPPSDGPDFTTREVDTGPVDFVIKGKQPDLDKWATDIATRLDTFTQVQQVNQFEVSVRASKSWTYVKYRSPEAMSHFEDLVAMRKEQLS